MKYLAFLFTLTMLCFVACESEQTSITEELEVEETQLTSRNNYLCVSSNPSFPNINCPNTGLPPGWVYTPVANGMGGCTAVITYPAGFGQGIYCSFQLNNGILGGAAIPAVVPGAPVVSPIFVPPGMGAIVLNNIRPGTFIFNVEASGLGAGCWSAALVC